jgi:hypothetical protein
MSLERGVSLSKAQPPLLQLLLELRRTLEQDPINAGLVGRIHVDGSVVHKDQLGGREAQVDNGGLVGFWGRLPKALLERRRMRVEGKLEVRGRREACGGGIGERGREMQFEKCDEWSMVVAEGC